MLRLAVSVRTGLQYAPVWVGNEIAGSSPILLWPVLEAGVVVELHIELNRSPWGLLWHERSSSSLNNFISSGSQTSSFPHQPVTARIPWMGQSSLRWEGDKAGQVQVPFSASLRPLGTSHDCRELSSSHFAIPFMMAQGQDIQPFGQAMSSLGYGMSVTLSRRKSWIFVNNSHTASLLPIWIKEGKSCPYQTPILPAPHPFIWAMEGFLTGAIGAHSSSCW